MKSAFQKDHSPLSVLPRPEGEAGPPDRLHVALIMDGNGRWATERGRPRTDGHRAGAKRVRPLVRAAPTLGVRTLTLYAFSSDNWKRPAAEVEALMRLFARFLRREAAHCRRRGVRLRVIGRRDRLAPPLRRAVQEVEEATAGGRALTLRLAIDYSARDAIVRAAGRLREANGEARAAPSRRGFAEALGRALSPGDGPDAPAPDVDLLIRTGREKRLSDFLLWECAYAELRFLDTLWPDFTPAAFAEAVRDFRQRTRRFGAV